MKKNNNELVTIIVPIYNAQKTIKKCVDSLLKQTFRNIKIILVNDGSTDNSGRICDEYAKKYRCVCVIHKENGGSSEARNEGIKSLPDDGYTTFCDADDWMPQNAIEKMYKLSIQEKADISCGILQRVTSCGIKIPSIIPKSLTVKCVYKENELQKRLLPSFFGITDFPGYMPTKLYKNVLLKKSIEFMYPVKFFQEDIAFNLQMVLLAKRIAVMPDVVYFYRVGGGTSKFMPDFLDDCISLYKFKINQIEKYHLDEEMKFTSAVELKNELYTWLEMYCIRYDGMKNAQLMKDEIRRTVVLEEIKEAVYYPKSDNSGVPGFRDAVCNQNIDELYKIITQYVAKGRIKRIIKKLLFI